MAYSLRSSHALGSALCLSFVVACGGRLADVEPDAGPPSGDDAGAVAPPGPAPSPWLDASTASDGGPAYDPDAAPGYEDSGALDDGPTVFQPDGSPSGPYPSGAIAAISSLNVSTSPSPVSVVSIYDPASTTKSAPLGVVSGAWASGCENIGALAFDAEGSLYVGCNALVQTGMKPDVVYVFASGSYGESTPIREITGPKDPSTLFGGLVVSPAGELYASWLDLQNNVGSILAAGPNDATLNLAFADATLGDGAGGLAFDSSGTLYVTHVPTNAAYSPIFLYDPADAGGGHVPFGSEADFRVPRGIAIDPEGEIVVAGNLTATGASDGRVVVYSKGDVVRTITGDATGLDQPTGLAVDASGSIYVALLGEVEIFYPDDDGNVAPRTYLPGAGGSVAVLK